MDAGVVFLRPQVSRAAAVASSRHAGVLAFHRRFPGYAPTPVIEMPVLAAGLGVGRVLVKDESQRMGLTAFKILGASWAIARVLARRFGLPGELDFGLLAPAARDVTFTTATDGNHGRAVARVAAVLGAAADVFVPDGLDAGAIDLIEAEGAVIHPVAGDYDQAVRCAAMHADDAGAELVQDTAWPGYEQVPGWIAEGYSTLLGELDEHVDPDLVVVPAGVGSLAQAVVTHYRGRAHVVSAEPDTADCVHRSLLAGRPVTVTTGRTAMAGLNCGTVSSLAWPILRDGLSGAVTVTDEQAAAAAVDLAALGVSSGPCGAAALAAARCLPLEALALDHGSTVVLLSTEGARP